MSMLTLPCTLLLIVILPSVSWELSNSTSKPPHILFVLIDDLGWGNVGFHMDPDTPLREVQTPVMDRLAQKEGLELHRHYVHQSCTGTRTALQSGRFPVHVQTSLKNPEDPSSGMPRNLTGLAEHMKASGRYATHYVGKWDVGMASPQHTPKGRGYDTSLHYFEHKNDFWTQACMQSACCTHHMMHEPRANVTTNGTVIYDLWDTDHPARDLRGVDYEEFIFQRRMLNLIDNHAGKMGGEAEQSMFLFYAPHVAHCPLQVPQSYLDQFDFMENDEDLCQAQTSTVIGPNDTKPAYSCRKQYHAMVKLLDDILESLVQRLQFHGMWDNTLMVVTSDNGGPVSPDESGATNFPLRGGKYSVFEGGVRAAAFASGGFLPVHRRGQRVTSPIHISDWYATLPVLAGVDVHGKQSLARFDDPRVPSVDGINVWPLLAGNDDGRFHDRELPLDSTALLVGDYKLIWREDKNVTESGWTAPTYPNAHTGKHGIRNKSVNCSTGCLFNVVNDPSEKQDIAATNPARLQCMQQRLVELRRGFFENDDRGIDSCPEGYNSTDKDLLCACWMAVNYYGGFFGPYQDVDVAASLSLQQHEDKQAAK